MLVAGLLLQPGTAPTPAPPRLPDECPRLLLTWHPGMPLPTTPPAEIGPGVVAAIWDSGIVLRAESIDRPHASHVIGNLPATERDELLQSVSASAVWSQSSIWFQTRHRSRSRGTAAAMSCVTPGARMAPQSRRSSKRFARGCSACSCCVCRSWRGPLRSIGGGARPSSLGGASGGESRITIVPAMRDVYADTPGSARYAGFWIRVAANVLDDPRRQGRHDKVVRTLVVRRE